MRRKTEIGARVWWCLECDDWYKPYKTETGKLNVKQLAEVIFALGLGGGEKGKTAVVDWVNKKIFQGADAEGGLLAGEAQWPRNHELTLAVSVKVLYSFGITTFSQDGVKVAEGPPYLKSDYCACDEQCSSEEYCTNEELDKNNGQCAQSINN